MSNIGAKIVKENFKKMKPENSGNNVKQCKHREGNICLFDGICLQQDQIYKVTLDNITTGSNFEYIGSCSTTMRERYQNHKSDFNNINRKTSSTLAEKIWEMKEKNEEFNINWEILESAVSYKPGANRCHLCLREIYLITFKKQDRTRLNKRSEFWGFCRHRRKWKLKNFI